MILYHGTAEYNLESFLRIGVKPSKRNDGNPCICMSTCFREATLFALRKTPIINMDSTGIVLEFKADHPTLRMKRFKGQGLLRDESEIRVYNPEFLRLVAYWRYKGFRDWEKCEV